MSGDSDHLIPDNVEASEQPTCTFSFTTTTITQISSYSESLSVDANADFEGWGASFSASVDYKEAKETVSNQETRLYSTKAECIVYAASIYYNNAKLSNNFRQAVLELNSTGDFTDYYNLIDQYGTHFVSSIKMGGRYGYQSEMSNSKVMEMSSKGTNVKMAAGYSGVASVKASSATETQKKQSEEFNKARTEVKEFFVGGGPPSGDEDWTPHAWSTTVAENPLPIRYKLVSIEQLFTSERFPEDNNIHTKSETLKRIMTLYCQRISSDPELCGKDFQDAKPMIPVKIVHELKQEPLSSMLPIPAYFYPVLEPYERVLGVLLGSKTPDSTVVIKSHNVGALSDVVKPASSWKQSDHPFQSLFSLPKFVRHLFAHQDS